MMTPEGTANATHACMCMHACTHARTSTYTQIYTHAHTHTQTVHARLPRNTPYNLVRWRKIVNQSPSDATAISGLKKAPVKNYTC